MAYEMSSFSAFVEPFSVSNAPRGSFLSAEDLKRIDSEDRVDAEN
jgi:hypothetical protein